MAFLPINNKAAGIPTFCEATAAVYAEQHRSWKNTKHRAQWLATLETYAAPHIGDTPVNEVEGAAVRDVLMAIWLTKPETARRVRQRIGTVIDWAVAKGFREAPLSMTAVNRSLPKQKRKDTHHPSLPYAEVPQFMERLAERETVGRLALAAVILTAARSGEIRGADWSEVDTEAGLWTVPAARMKGGREHVVPLSDAACRVFERIGVLTGRRGLVFPGLVAGQPLSDMTLTKVCRAMGVAAVPHGFRSSFRDWVAEETGFDSEVAEMALAHTIENKVEAAYRRGNLLEKRRAMMAAWGEYCNGQTGGRVVRLAAVTNG